MAPTSVNFVGFLNMPPVVALRRDAGRLREEDDDSIKPRDAFEIDLVRGLLLRKAYSNKLDGLRNLGCPPACPAITTSTPNPSISSSTHPTKFLEPSGGDWTIPGSL